MLRYSFVPLLHTVFETQLFRICDTLRDEKNLPVSASELKGSAIEQVKTYLTKFGGWDFVKDPVWGKIKDYQKIRDCITHGHGKVAGSQHEPRLRKIELQGFSIVDDMIQLDATFCIMQYATFRGFFEVLFNVLGWGEVPLPKIELPTPLPADFV